jgi:hypothetical protein
MLGDENFEALLLMNIHEAVLLSIDPEKVIDKCINAQIIN